MSETKTPAEAEAVDENATVTWRGHTFEVPRKRTEWPLDAELALRDDDPIGFVQAMLGDEFDKVRAERPKTGDVAELGADMVKALGFGGVGESAASSD